MIKGGFDVCFRRASRGKVAENVRPIHSAAGVGVAGGIGKVGVIQPHLVDEVSIAVVIRRIE